LYLEFTAAVMSFEVSEPILNSPFEKSKEYWYIQEGEQPQRREGRRAGGFSAA